MISTMHWVDLDEMDCLLERSRSTNRIYLIVGSYYCLGNRLEQSLMAAFAWKPIPLVSVKRLRVLLSSQTFASVGYIR